MLEHDIPTEGGSPHRFGEDMAEAAERNMTDILNVPIFLTHFPVEIKAFYMRKDETDGRVTESVDVLMPGVGEIVGGSMRMEGDKELMEAYKREENLEASRITGIPIRGAMARAYTVDIALA